MEKTTQKHTPGPWTYRAYSTHPHHIIEAEDREGVAYTMDHEADSKANATLIAAAPDLLAALERLLNAEALVDDEYYAEIEAAEEQARAAIAKAKGEAKLSAGV